MKFPVNKIQTQAKDDYEKAWLETSKLLSKSGSKFKLKPLGKDHPVQSFISDSRLKMVNLGFEEIMMPMIVDEEDVYREYGPEAALILDRLFYLAELPRPEIGVSQKKLQIIRSIVPNFNNLDHLRTIFRRYKKGEIEADDLIEVIVEELSIA
ncbi:MAG: O-phosphoserine--tRNA ligase, partial [Candidatus Lokiarchaeota archaeon]|nr:O-phosphoserine--tRNA ligase [Candidatus Lokiarchaeota archaeon]